MTSKKTTLGFLLLGLSLPAMAMSLGCSSWAVEYTSTTPVAPPAPYEEFVGEAPGDEYVWVNGYWWWDGSDYVWVRGRWASPPAQGYTWVRSGWVAEGDRYVYVHGRWVAPQAPVVRYQYVHRAPAVRVQTGGRYRYAAPRATPRRAAPRARRAAPRAR